MNIFSKGFTSIVAVLVFLGNVALAQGTSVPFGIVNHDSTQPIEIVSDSFTVSQTNGRAVFLGNVVAGQGEMRLKADKIVVEYDSAKDQQTGKIGRMVATGNVTLVSGSEAAEAQKAIYSIKNANIILMGNVLLTQGQNALSGQKMSIDLNTGSAKIEGRVKTIFKAGASK